MKRNNSKQYIVCVRFVKKHACKKNKKIIVKIKSKEQLTCFEKIKKFLFVLFTSVKKLKIENSAVSMVKLITSLVCNVFAKIGYLVATLFFLAGLQEIIINFSVESALMFLVCLMLSVIIALISKLVDATGIEIEETNDKNLVFGISAFLTSFIPLILSIISLCRGNKSL